MKEEVVYFEHDDDDAEQYMIEGCYEKAVFFFLYVSMFNILIRHYLSTLGYSLAVLFHSNPRWAGYTTYPVPCMKLINYL